MLGKPSTKSALKGCVAAAHPLAAAAGTRILAQGGNAFDAAVAVAATLNVVEPQMSGLAGMGLATCYVAATGRVETCDFIPPVSQGFRLEPGVTRDDMVRGPRGIGMPGSLGGWHALNARHGRLPFADLLQPAIGYAREGFPLLELGAFCIGETARQLAAHPELLALWAEVYMPQGRAPELGDVLVQADLARTLDTIAAEGIDAFYRGPIGEKVVAHVASLGGALTMADLAACTPRWSEPTAIPYRDLVVHVAPPPSQGFQYLLALKILEGFDLAALPRNGVDHLDLVLRAIRLAGGERIRADNPDAAGLAAHFAPEKIAALRARVADGQPIVDLVESGDAVPPSATKAGTENTTSFSIADAEGNLVCLTQSLGQFFGSGIVVPGTGICLNDMPAFGDLSPESATCMTAGGPMVQPMAPSIITKDGKGVLALGTPGSFGIMQTQVQALVQIADFGLGPQDAIEAPRVRLWDFDRIEVEGRIPQDITDALAARGHAVTRADDWTTKVGGMHAVARNPSTGVLTGGHDPRRDGAVALL